MRLITQRSQVQILPPLQVKVQVRGSFDLRIREGLWRSRKQSASRGRPRTPADRGGSGRSGRLDGELLAMPRDDSVQRAAAARCPPALIGGCRRRRCGCLGSRDRRSGSGRTSGWTDDGAEEPSCSTLEHGEVRIGGGHQRGASDRGRTRSPSGRRWRSCAPWASNMIVTRFGAESVCLDSAAASEAGVR